MLNHSPATRLTLRSTVVISPLGVMIAGSLILGLLLLGLATLLAVVGIGQRATVPSGLLGLGLLGLAGRGAARSNRPMLLTSCREALHLEPIGRSLTQGLPAETIPLASIKAYTYWARIFRYGVFLQYHLRLELADGRVVHVADRPGTRPDDLAGTVRLDVVASNLSHWVKPGTPRRRLFYLTRAAQIILRLSWIAIATALALMWLGYPAGSLLLFPTIGYCASYYLGRNAAALTA